MLADQSRRPRLGLRRTEILDRQGLDDRYSSLPDIAAYFTGNRLETILKLTRSESAAMTDPLQDLQSRAHALAGLTDDATGPGWALDFTQIAGRTGIMLRAKHPRANEFCPITLTAAIDPSRLTAEDISALERQSASKATRLGPRVSASPCRSGNIVIADRPNVL